MLEILIPDVFSGNVYNNVGYHKPGYKPQECAPPLYMKNWSNGKKQILIWFWYWDCRDQVSSSWLQRWEEANLKRMSCRTEGLLITNDRTGWQHRDTCWHLAFKLVSHTPVAQPSESNIWLISCHFSVVNEPLYWHWHWLLHINSKLTSGGPGLTWPPGVTLLN